MMVINGTATVSNELPNEQQKITFIKFLQLFHPFIEDLPFVGFFTVIDIVTLKLLCRDTAKIFNEEF